MAARGPLLAVLLMAGALPAAAQRPAAGSPAQTDLNSELARIRDATVLESAGDLKGAEAIVIDILNDNPASLTALLTYERLLGVQGRLPDAMPAVDRLIELDPHSVIGHQVRLRVYADLDDAARIEWAAATWIETSPNLETPYREAAVVWRRRHEVARAIAVLEQGRRRIDRPDALALELGDAYADAGDMQRAAAEWARAVGPEGRGFLLVQRRVQAQPDGGARAIPLLVDQLSGGSPSLGRRKAAALLSMDAGLDRRAERLARELAAQVPSTEREQLLVELARRADAAGLYRVAIWSYDEMLSGAREPGSALAIRTRLAELALLAGDTARAADVYRHLEKASVSGSPQRRQAMALRLQLTIREGDLTRAAAELDSFRTEFGQAPELDATAALLATRYLDRGSVADAERVLAGVNGPRSAHVRGRLFIRSGDLARARHELLRAAPQLQGREATESIALAALLMRVSPQGGDLIARAIAADDAERQRLVHDARTGTERFPAGERAAVLEFMAAIADGAGLIEDADAIRREIVTRLPRTHEAPGALLALARRALGERGSADEAIVLLEKLILEYPRSALAPQARRELDRLHGRTTAP
jgi:tetratricopeptide (TPR) repeat protein